MPRFFQPNFFQGPQSGPKMFFQVEVDVDRTNPHAGIVGPSQIIPNIPGPSIVFKQPSLDKQGRLKQRRPDPPNIRAFRLQEDQRLAQAEAFEERFQLWGRGTRAEFICWEYLVNEKKLEEDRDFLFQSSKFGGRRVFGGLVIDFYIFVKNLIWQPQGEFFHLLQPQDRTRQLIESARLNNQGYTVVYLYYQDLLTRPDYVLNLAWEGVGVQNPYIDT